MQPNRKTAALTASPTLALAARATEMLARGVDVVNMAVGEPDFDAPAAVQAAAVAHVGSGEVRYCAAAGRPALRATIARHLSATRGVDFTPAEVIVTHSTKHALSSTLLALVEPGDEVLLPAPAWGSYEEEVRFAGGIPRLAPPRPDLGPDFEAIAAAITPATRGVMVNDPCNPSGYVWGADEVARMGELLVEHDLWIISDEIYRRLVYDGVTCTSPVSLSPEVRARTVIADGASKAYAMTGYRIGFIAAPEPVAAAVGRLQSQLNGCPNAISQAAFQAALEEEPAEVEAMRLAFDERRGVLVEGLRAAGLETAEPRGAFYAYPRVSPFLDERGSAGFCEDLLEEEALVIVPGSVFGTDEYVRFSYATSLENVQRALERVGRFLAKRR